MEQADIGLIGLAVMGQNLVLNMADHGIRVAVFNRTVSKVDAFLAQEAAGKSIIGTKSLADFFKSLKRPRRAIFMVKAGPAVDELIGLCLPYLEKGDILIDGGNSYFEDTNRRCQFLKEKGICFLGVGISGGEEGARFGPSIMPGGSVEGWPAVKDIFTQIAARSDDGIPCCDWVGQNGAGHFVKMVHNGIEYGDMQLIAEVYDLLHRGLQLSPSEISDIFSRWNEGHLKSYLIEITAKILQKKDSDGSPLVDNILDSAEQKGTGRWTVQQALDMGEPLSLIGEAVFARNLSAMKDERVLASSFFPSKKIPMPSEKSKIITLAEAALFASKITSYAQGFMMLQKASQKYQFSLNLGSIALLWRGGCIIRSAFLNKIKEAFDLNPSLSCLFLDPYFQKEIMDQEEKWRKFVTLAIEMGIPIPCSGAALSFFDGWRSAKLPANLIQAQRDFFGAHTYERVDQPRGAFFHTQW